MVFDAQQVLTTLNRQKIWFKPGRYLKVFSTPIFIVQAD